MEIRLAAFFGILLAGLGVGPSRAEPSSAAALDVRAEPVLRELAAHFQGLAAFRVRLEAETRFADPDPRPVFVSRATLAVKRPDKLALSVQNPLVGDLRITGDGTRRVAYLPALQRYTVTPARPGPAGPALDLGAASPIHLPLLGVLLEADPYAALTTGGATAVYRGRGIRDGVDCHRLAIAHPDFECDVWIRAGPAPVPVAIEPRLAPLSASARPDSGSAGAALVFREWELDPELPAAVFAPDLPPEARVCATLFPEPAELLAGVGAPAPEVDLPRLDGGRFVLADQRGRRPVLLLFWTSWAGPCRPAIPVFERLLARYAARGLAGLAVNVGEPAETAAAFWREQGGAAPVLLDASGETAARFQVSGVPHLVLIDRAGVVRESALGYGPDLERELGLLLEASGAAEP